MSKYGKKDQQKITCVIFPLIWEIEVKTHCRIDCSWAIFVEFGFLFRDFGSNLQCFSMYFCVTVI